MGEVGGGAVRAMREDMRGDRAGGVGKSELMGIALRWYACIG